MVVLLLHWTSFLLAALQYISYDPHFYLILAASSVDQNQRLGRSYVTAQMAFGGQNKEAALE